MLIAAISTALCGIGIAVERKKQTLDDLAMLVYLSILTLNGYFLLANPFQGKEMGLFGETFLYFMAILLIAPLIGCVFGLISHLYHKVTE